MSRCLQVVADRDQLTKGLIGNSSAFLVTACETSDSLVACQVHETNRSLDLWT